MVVAEVFGALLGTVCHHCQRFHLWVLQEWAALGWRGVMEGSGSVLHREAEDLGQVVEAHKETAQGSGYVVEPESQNVRVAAPVVQSVHAVVGAAEGSGYVVVPESQNVRVAALVARSVHAEAACPSRMGSAAPFPSPSAFPSCHTG